MLIDRNRAGREPTDPINGGRRFLDREESAVVKQLKASIECLEAIERPVADSGIFGNENADDSFRVTDFRGLG